MDKKLKEKLEDFLHQPKFLKEFHRLASAGQKSLVVEYTTLLEFSEELATYLLDFPKDFFQEADEILSRITKIPKACLRIKGLGQSVDIRNIRAAHLGKFIQVEGIMVRSSDVRPEATVAVFRCRKCGEEARVQQVGEFLVEPPSCPNVNCRGKRSFDLVVEETEFRDWQSVRIQEPPAKLRGGRMPRYLNGIVRDDFVEKAIPGNHVVITGILYPLQERLTRKGGQKGRVFMTVLFVNHIEVLQKGIEEAEVKPEDEEKIKELAKDPWLARKVIQSIAPAIKGHDLVKEAIALQLFGCDPVELPDGTRIRGDSHILLVGDPGTAKSQLLKWVGDVAPRGIYTSGKKTTGAGLTAAAVRDELLGGSWTLEAGALVIADGGIACIDEFEKMDPQESGALLESMEQQTISVAKAGIVATLNTRTAVLAATNPRWGRFDDERTVPEQLAIDPVLLSRFDLIFIMHDRPSVEEDRALSQHVLQIHAKKVKAPPISPEMLRKMIIYAKKNIHPELKSKEVQKVISDFYVDWRKTAAAMKNPIPITVRQLEALVRLAKSYARMRLSNEVTVEDATRAIELVKKSLEQVGLDLEKRVVDVDLIFTGMPRSQREQIAMIFDIVKELEEQYGGAAPKKEIIERAKEKNISERFVEQVLEKEIQRGSLWVPQPEFVARVK
ncbi:MAG: minichromosome maintenance protein MCM [Candidatus Hadarchaeales archaeon]